jgi:hypothetical protein
MDDRKPEYRNTDYRNTPSILATLECLPEVVEKNTDSSWQLFVTLQSRGESVFQRTLPSGVQDLGTVEQAATGDITVQEVMAEARRLNRIAPLQPHWHRLYLLLKESAQGAEPPAAMTVDEAARTPPLVRRIRVRDQVEWAEQHGQLAAVLRFFRGLSEEEWAHMGR